MDYFLTHREQMSSRVGSRGGGVLWVRTPPPLVELPLPLFWGTPIIEEEGEKTLRACARMHRVLEVNSYADTPRFRNPEKSE